MECMQCWILERIDLRIIYLTSRDACMASPQPTSFWVLVFAYQAHTTRTEQVPPFNDPVQHVSNQSEQLSSTFAHSHRSDYTSKPCR